MSTNIFNQNSYALTQPLVNVFPAPIVSVRAPTPSDRAQIGTLWIDTINNDAFTLTSIKNNTSNWAAFTGGTGFFTNLTVTGTSTFGNTITVTGGGVHLTSGSVTVSTGNIDIPAGVITAAEANITSSASIGSGGLSCSGGIDVTAGNLSVDTGDVNVSEGDINAVAGNIVSLVGNVEAGQMLVVSGSGDPGSGVPRSLCITGSITGIGTGTLTILTSTGAATSGKSAGFLKFYSPAVGSDPIYIPFFLNTVS